MENTMDELKWLEVAINTTPDKLDDVTAKLTAAGMTGLVIEDEAEFLTFLEENRQYWDYVDQELLDSMKGVTRVKFYVTDDEDGHKQLRQYTSLLDCEYTTAALGENDWAYSWQKYYKPLEVGQRLYVVPEWERDKEVPADRVPFYLNPGLTFGTGSHASTQLCLEGVEAHTAQGCTVLDLGCGSGILSIAALCLGASHAVAVDIDPKAVDVAYENAALNGIGRDRYLVRAGDVLTDRVLAGELAQQRYDLVLANIVADVIIPLSAQVPALLADGGTFLCSGIIDTRAHEVEAALKRNGLTVTKKREKNGWVALEARK
jgi:ribosomal protein L11 methyltransferase